MLNKYYKGLYDMGEILEVKISIRTPTCLHPIQKLITEDVINLVKVIKNYSFLINNANLTKQASTVAKIFQHEMPFFL